MLEFAEIILKILSTCAGIFFIYVGSFIYENEEKKINNALENIWIVIDDTSSKSISKHLSLIRTSIELINKTLDKYFGSNLLNIKAILVSYLLSLFSLSISFFIYALSQMDGFVSGIFSVQNTLIFFVLGILFCYSALKIPFWKKLTIFKKLIVLIALIISALIMLILYVLSLRTDDGIMDLVTFVLIFILMIGTDFLFIALSRKIFKKLAKKGNELGIYLMLALNAMFITFVVILPYYLPKYLYKIDDSMYFFHSDFWSSFTQTIYYIPMSSIPVVFISMMVFLLILLLYVHRLFWPLISRPIYSLQRNGILKYKKALLSLGLFFLGFSFPNSVDYIKKVMEYLT